MLLQCHPQIADAAGYRPRGRNCKYLLWLQSKVLSVSRLFFSSPGENISDSASIKLYNADIEGDIAYFLYVYDRKSLFNPILHGRCWAAPQPVQTAAAQGGPWPAFFSSVTSASLLHYQTRSYFYIFLPNNVLFSVCSLHQQCSTAISVDILFRLGFNKADKVMKNRSWIQQPTFKNIIPYYNSAPYYCSEV